jgi:hypothetical protein
MPTGLRVHPPPGPPPLLRRRAPLVPVFYVSTNLRTLAAKVEQALRAQSTINHDGTYVVSKSFDIDGVSITPSETGLLPLLIISSTHFTLVTWLNERLLFEAL